MPIRTPLLLLLCCTAATVTAQTPADWRTPRTEHRHPDFQGNWGNLTLTPLERPRELGDRLVYTREEALELEQAAIGGEQQRQLQQDPDRAPPPAGATINNEAEEAYSDRGLQLTRLNGEYRSSLIVSPADGRYPFRPEGRQLDIYGQWRAQGFGPHDGPEMFPIGERCLAANATMPPMQVLPYNSNIQIVQNAEYVMILGEMVHDARIIRLDASPLPRALRPWFGDSTGYYEGDTLVVKTAGFRAENSNFRLASSDQLQVVERFTRLNEAEIFYTYTVTDPVLYEQPIRVEMVLNRVCDGEQLYEFACHEGNYSMAGSLSGARHEERLAGADPEQ